VARYQDVEETLLEDARVLREGGPLLAEALARAQVPSLLHDKSRIVGVNGALLEWLGYEEADLVGAPLEALAAGEDPVALRAALGGRAEPSEQAHVQRFRNKSGELRCAQVLARGSGRGTDPMTFALLQPWGSSLRPGEFLHLLEAAIDQLHDIVFITEAESIDEIGRRVVFVNGAFSRATGFDPREVIGRTPNLTVGEGTERAALKRIEAGLRAGKPVHEQLQKYAKDGTSYWVDLTIIPVFDEQGKHTHWVSVQRDVTETKRLHDNLIQTERLASAGMLAAGLTHELNNPLTGVTMGLKWVSELLPALIQRVRGEAGIPLDQSELLALGLDLETALGAVSDALEGAERVQSSLEYLSMLAGTQEQANQPLVVHDLLDAALESLEHRFSVPEVVIRDYARVPFVVGGEIQLIHVFFNLLCNAVQALPDSVGLDQRIVIRVADEPPRFVRIEIEDSGAGIPPDIAKRLFSPFVSSRARGLGKGLGLFMAREVIQRLQGQLSFSSVRDRGTTFVVRLPAGGAQASLTHPARRGRALADAQVLVIDRGFSTAQAIRRALAPSRRFCSVSSLPAALELLASAGFDLVFAPLDDPELDTLELFHRAVAADPALRERFVLTSDPGAPADELEQRARELAITVLERPLGRDKVLSVAWTALGFPRT
jgi:PAS domain S-box-containing protein